MSCAATGTWTIKQYEAILIPFTWDDDSISDIDGFTAEIVFANSSGTELLRKTLTITDSENKQFTLSLTDTETGAFPASSVSPNLTAYLIVNNGSGIQRVVTINVHICKGFDMS